MFRRVNAILGTAIVAALILPALAQQPAPLKVIGFMTDFDVKDDAVGICKAVMDGVAPGVRIIDITHQSEPYNIAMGARFLAGSAPYFPRTRSSSWSSIRRSAPRARPSSRKSRVGQYLRPARQRPAHARAGSRRHC